MMYAEDLYEKLKSVDKGVCQYSLEKCEELVPVINRINELKREKNAIVLAHTYVNAEIIYGVGDHVGDSYYLSKMARDSDAEMIVFSAVRFMAETAKILSPDKKVVQPNDVGGCSLADSITGAQVRQLKQSHPDYTFVCYINTTADVKAACDVCVTSSNVYKIVEQLDTDKVFFLPDRLMAQNVIEHLKSKGIDKEVKFSDGTCYVHEGYEPEMIDYVRLKNEGVSVAVHPECTPEVVAKADYVGSTGGIYDHIKETQAESYLVVSECGLGSRIQAELPEKKIVGSCTFCKHMQGNSLDHIERALRDDSDRYLIEVPDEIRIDAQKCIDRMFVEAEK